MQPRTRILSRFVLPLCLLLVVVLSAPVVAQEWAEAFGAHHTDGTDRIINRLRGRRKISRRFLLAFTSGRLRKRCCRHACQHGATQQKSRETGSGLGPAFARFVTSTHIRKVPGQL